MNINVPVDVKLQVKTYIKYLCVTGCDTAVKTYKELEQENIVLKQRLTKTHRALEETMAQLTTANQRKKQVERAICRQLHKTHHILKTARVSLKATADCVTPSAEEMEQFVFLKCFGF